MIIKKLIGFMMAVAVSAVPIAAGASVNAAGTEQHAHIIVAQSGTALPANTSAAMAVESSNSYYAYSTEAIMRMSVIQIGGKKYALPLTMEQLAADGWERFGFAKSKPGELYVVNCGDAQLSLSENKEGVIERIVELYPSSGTLVIPTDAGVNLESSEADPDEAGAGTESSEAAQADSSAGTESGERDQAGTGIKNGISEGDLISRLNQLPLPWECAHLKNGTTRYKVLVPLGGAERLIADDEEQDADATAVAADDASAQAGGTNSPKASSEAGKTSKTANQAAKSDGKTSKAADQAQSYPACEYVITVGDRQVKAVEIRLVSVPGPDGWSDEIIGFRVAAYYEKKADERPPLFRIEEQKDGRVLVRLYEDLGDHIATWALYKSDRTGKGYDVAFDPNEKKVIDFMN